MVMMKENSNVTVRMFFKVMGWPKESLNEHLKRAVNALKAQGMRILREDYATPELEGEKLFTSHLEVEVVAESLNKLLAFCLVFPPLVLEVLDPPEFYLTAADLQDILADVLAKTRDDQQNIRILDAQISAFKKALESAKPPAPAQETQNTVVLGGNNDVSKEE